MLNDFREEQNDGGASIMAALCGERIQQAAADQAGNLLLVFESGHGLSIGARHDNDTGLHFKFRALPVSECAERIRAAHVRILNLATAMGLAARSKMEPK